MLSAFVQYAVGMYGISIAIGQVALWQWDTCTMYCSRHDAGHAYHCLALTQPAFARRQMILLDGSFASRPSIHSSSPVPPKKHYWTLLQMGPSSLDGHQKPRVSQIDNEEQQNVGRVVDDIWTGLSRTHAHSRSHSHPCPQIHQTHKHMQAPKKEAERFSDGFGG